MLVPIWPVYGDREVFNFDMLPTTKANTDVGGLKGLILARGTKVGKYTDIPPRPTEEEYTDEDGNTVSKSDMVAGKTYSVKATLKPEYAANFEFIDASGAVLPDASVSTSQEFDYSGENSGGNMDASEIEKMLREQQEWNRKLQFMYLGILGTIALIVLVMVILFGRLLKTVKTNGIKVNPTASKRVGKDKDGIDTD